MTSPLGEHNASAVERIDSLSYRELQASAKNLGCRCLDGHDARGSSAAVAWLMETPAGRIHTRDLSLSAIAVATVA